MSKISQVFKKRQVFIAYLTAGQIDLNYTLDAALALIEGGVDILEIGVPFSDPIADGPVIQKAMQDALVHKINLFRILEFIKQLKKSTDVPIVLFTYYNPILQAQKINIFEKINEALVDGILLVDLPPEEAELCLAECKKFEIAPILVVAPSTREDRIRKIAKYAKGFLYYACRKGTTGMQRDLPLDFVEKMRMIRSNCNLPVVAGFGISSRETAKEVLTFADGFVVGSLFVDAIAKGASPQELTQIAKDIDPRKR